MSGVGPLTRRSVCYCFLGVSDAREKVLQLSFALNMLPVLRRRWLAGLCCGFGSSEVTVQRSGYMAFASVGRTVYR